jgi:outer membrane biosynthesis protein TonB
MPHRKQPNESGEGVPKKGSWLGRLSAGERVLASLGFLTLVAAALVVPEVRYFLHLEQRPPETAAPGRPQNSGQEKDSVPESTESGSKSPVGPPKPIPNTSPLPERQSGFASNTAAPSTGSTTSASTQREHELERANYEIFGVTETVANQHLLKKIEPSRPSNPLAFPEVPVKIRLTIGEDGAVTEARAIEANPKEPVVVKALKAARQWRYKPFVINGEPASVETVITMQVVPDSTRVADITSPKR